MMTRPTSVPAPEATDFDGYLMVFVIPGEGPGIWRVTADPEAVCEEPGCPSVRPMYRTIGLTHEFDPQLGVCQEHIQRTWDDRMDDREDPDPSGARAHMYPPRG